MDVIGFGGAGCKIARALEEHSQYNIHYVDIGISGDSNYSLLKSSTMEAAEQSTPNFFKLVEGLKSEVTFICSGGGITSGSILAMLEQIKHLQVTVVYIKPDVNFLNDKAKQRERVVHGVLQQFARAGLLKQIYLVDNTKIAEILGGLSINEYHKEINKMLVDSLHMLNFLKKSNSVMTNVSVPHEINRVSTLGIYDIEKGEEKYFYDIENIREKHFYFAFNEDTLNKEKKLLSKISKQIENAGQSEYTTVSYDITATTYEKNFAYIEAHTNFIQEEKTVDNTPE